MINKYLTILNSSTFELALNHRVKGKSCCTDFCTALHVFS